MRKTFIITLMALFTMSFITADNASDADKILGIWTPSSGKARVKISKIGKKYFGKVIWLKTPKDPETKKSRTDINNPNDNLKNVPLKGLRLLKDFVYSGDDKWSKGTIYDPEKGKTYSCNITMKDNNTLSIRGYIGISLIGRTDIWKRYVKPKK